VSHEAVKRILTLLEEAVHTSRRSRREIERTLGLGQGYLGSLFRGRIELKVWHVYTLARELGVEPLGLFLEAEPPRDPAWLLAQLGAQRSRLATPPKDDEPLTREQVEDLVRRTLRAELEKLRG
jgi:hypothetical protein